MKTANLNKSSEERKIVLQAISNSINDCNQEKMTQLIKDYGSEILSWELPSQHDSSKSCALTICAQHAFFYWEKYEPFLYYLVEDLEATKYDSGDKVIQFAFERSISYDGKFNVESRKSFFEYLIKIGARVELKDEVPKLDIDDQNSCYILLLLTVSNVNSDAPNALWFYQNILKVFHAYPKEAPSWYETFERYATTTTKQYINHPCILDKTRTYVPETVTIGSCNLTGFKITDKEQLIELSNTIVMGKFDVFSMQEVGDNRILLDLIRRLGPDWNFLISPQIKPHEGRGYVESYGFLYRNYFKLQDYGHISGDGSIQSRPMFYASFDVLGKNMHILSVHSSQSQPMPALLNLTKAFRKMSKTSLENLVFLGDFYLQSSSTDWNPVKEFNFVACFDNVTGVKNMRSSVTSTTPEAVKLYDNIWLNKYLANLVKEYGIITDLPWDSGHLPLYVVLKCEKAKPTDTKTLSEELGDWSFEEEKFWEDSDFFGPFFGSESNHLPNSWEPGS